MKNWLPIFKFIILIILVIIFMYIYNKRKSEKIITNLVETFQISTNPDIHTAFFDLSANYFTLTDAENGVVNNVPLDQQILQIGGSYGEIDIANLPWDTENKELTSSEALWGAIPVNATMAIFEKVYNANQLGNIDNLRFNDDTNKFHYNDSMFGFGTDSESAADNLKLMNAGMAVFMDYQIAEMFDKEVTTIARIIRGDVNTLTDVAKLANGHGLLSGAIKNLLSKVSSGGMSLAAIAAEKAAAKLENRLPNLKGLANVSDKFSKGVAKMTSAIKGSTLRIVDSVVTRSTMLQAGRAIASAAGEAAGSKVGAAVGKVTTTVATRAGAAGGEAAGKAAGKAVAKGTEKAVTKYVLKKLIAAAAEKIGLKAIAKLIEGIAETALEESIQLAVDAASLDPVKAAIDAVFWNIVLAILMVLQITGVTTKILNKYSDSLGCCPHGSAALDQIIPEWLNMLLMFTVPAYGNIISIFSPYLCIGTNPILSLKETASLPKYIRYNWLSCSFLNWPTYDCTAVSTLPLAGKTYKPTQKNSAGPGAILNVVEVILLPEISLSMSLLNLAEGNGFGNVVNDFIGMTQNNLYDWQNSENEDIPYTNLDDIAANPSAFTGVTKTYSGITVNLEYTPIVGENYKKSDVGESIGGKVFSSTTEDKNTNGFFYIDFTEPTALAEMAQFYYDWATRNPYDNGDNTITVDYISKISYVTASSLYSCDIMCEMVSSTYDINTGEKYSENTTYDHDRRFYYSCDPKQPNTPYWENRNDSTWTMLDDIYDAAYYDLNNITNVYYNIAPDDDQTYQTEIQDEMGNPISDLTLLPTADYLLTAYVQSDEALQRYILSSNLYMSNSNSSNFDPNVLDDGAVRTFYDDYTLSNTNYQTILSKAATWIGNGFTTSNLNNYVKNVVNASNALYLYHQISRPVGSTSNKQYTVVGCTHLDGTGPNASAPDITQGALETRFYTHFDVTPYIKRCTQINISLSRCMDISNIQLTVLEYYEQNPNKRIKTINSIKAKGKNVCSYIWDEVDIDTNGITTNYISNVKTDTIYQIDLSSCTFHLPPGDILYGRQEGPGPSAYISKLLNTSPSLTIYKNPLLSNDPNFSLQVPLQALPGTCYVISSNGQDMNGRPKELAATPSNTFGVLPRYDPETFVSLPEVIRPKTPIRIFYPQPPESNLGTYSNEYCSDPATLNNFIIDYNTNTTNVNKIASIIRTYGSGLNVCDMEVDMYIPHTNTMERTTLSFNMKVAEGFQINQTSHEVFYVDSNVSWFQAQSICSNYNGSLATSNQLSQAQSNGALWSQYGWIADTTNTVYNSMSSTQASASFYGVNCYGVKPLIGNPAIIRFNEGQYTELESYTYSSLNDSNGLNITINTALLPDPYSSGLVFSTPYLTQMKNDMGSNVTFFNDDLIKGFTSKTKGLRDMTDTLLIKLVGTQVLGGSNCASSTNSSKHIRCDDPVIIQRIIEQYNIDNTATYRFGVTQNTMTNVVQSSTNSSNTCHIIFENDKEEWGDYYNKGNMSSNNYLTENNLYLKEILMSNNSGSCDFFPIPNQVYKDISASDIALASESNLSPYVTSVRICTIPANGTNSNLITALHDYEAITRNTINFISYYMNVNQTTWDYYINQNISLGTNGTLDGANAQNNVLRIFYTNTSIYNGSTDCKPNYTYINGNFQLQILDVADFSIYISDSYLLKYISVVDTSTLSNASPLFTYYSGSMSDPLLKTAVISKVLTPYRPFGVIVSIG